MRYILLRFCTGWSVIAACASVWLGVAGAGIWRDDVDASWHRSKADDFPYVGMFTITGEGSGGREGGRASAPVAVTTTGRERGADGPLENNVLAGGCSGTLISPTTVLTAAHCFDVRRDGTDTVPFYVGVGVGPVWYTSSHLPVLHPDWPAKYWLLSSSEQVDVLKRGIDLALVRLDDAVTDVQPAELFQGESQGLVGFLAGFGVGGTGITGITEPGGKRAGENVIDATGAFFGWSDTLRIVDFDGPYDDGINTLGESQALDHEYIGAPGDSGGGWFVPTGSGYRLAGVQSFSTGPSGEASPLWLYNDHTVFTDLSAHLPWIISELNRNPVPVDFTNPKGRFFSDPTNWANEVLPNESNLARFWAPSTYTVSFDGDAAVHSLSINRGEVTFELGGHRFAAQHPWGYGIIQVDDGALTVENGEIAGDQLFVYNSALEPDIVVVTARGPTTRWTNTSEVEVAPGFGNATLAIVDGATFSDRLAFVHAFPDCPIPENCAYFGEGHVVVSGNGSTWNNSDPVFVGRAGPGTVRVEAGGRVSSNSAHISTGDWLARTQYKGSAHVTGAGSTWSTSGEFQVGDFGRGNLEITDGGAVTSLRALAGFFSGSSGVITVSGSSSRLMATDSLTIGFFNGSSGELSIKSGAVVSSPRGYIARSPLASGSVALQGAASTWSLEDALFIGGSKENAGGTGSLTLASAALSKVVVGKTLRIWPGGAMALNGGAVTVGEGRAETAARTVRVWEGGTVDLRGGKLNAATLQLSGGTLTGTGVVTANVMNSGVVRPGSSAGLLQTNGDFIQRSDGVLELEIGGVVPEAEYDVLSIGGNGALAGKAVLRFVDGFSPTAGNSFDLILATRQLQGAFEELEIQQLAPGFLYSAGLAGRSFRLTALSDGQFVPDRLPGDTNADGVLDLVDVNALAQQIAARTHDRTFELTNDNLVDQADLSRWVKELKNTWFGDANLDGEFDTTDLVQVFQAGKFETDSPAAWHEGDWNADLRFETGDLVVAFQDGGFEMGPRGLVQAVPEPVGPLPLILALLSQLWDPQPQASIAAVVLFRRHRFASHRPCRITDIGSEVGKRSTVRVWKDLARLNATCDCKVGV